MAEATSDITNWNILALLIGIPKNRFDHMKKDARNESELQQAVINEWLDNCKPSWAILVAGLRHKLVGKRNIGNEIAAKYPSKPL